MAKTNLPSGDQTDESVAASPQRTDGSTPQPKPRGRPRKIPAVLAPVAGGQATPPDQLKEVKKAGRENERVLVRRSVIEEIIEQMRQPPEVDGDQSARLQSMLAKVLGDEISRAYYYRLVFSVAYRAYEVHVQVTYISENNLDITKQKVTLPWLRFPEFADAVGIGRYTLPRLFVGKGTNEALLSVIHFLRRNNISFETILYTASLIEKAYAYHVLQTSGLNVDKHRSEKGLLF